MTILNRAEEAIRRRFDGALPFQLDYTSMQSRDLNFWYGGITIGIEPADAPVLVRYEQPPWIKWRQP